MTHNPADNHPASSPPPILLRATGDESAGAMMKVAGLKVLERAVRQFARTPTFQVILATDGTVAIPAALPPNVRLLRLGADPNGEIEALRLQAGISTIIGADVVRPKNGDLATRMRVVDEATRRAAEDALFADLLRGDLGFIARHLNKKISFRITRHVLCHLPVTPNQVTVGAAAIGLLGCVFTCLGTYPAMVAGLFLAQLQSILDGCDGELARVRFQQTAIGEWLDTLVDDFLNLAIIASMGIGVCRAGWGWPAIAAASAACAMYLLYNVVSYGELIKQGQGGELIKIRWKMAQGRDMKALWGESQGKPSPPSEGETRRQAHHPIEDPPRGGGGSTAMWILLALGRRDTFVFAWFVLAAINLMPVALVWAVLVSLFCCCVAVGQLVLPDDKVPS